MVTADGVVQCGDYGCDYGDWDVFVWEKRYSVVKMDMDGKNDLYGNSVSGAVGGLPAAFMENTPFA